MPQNSMMDAMLDFDPIDVAERLTGERRSDESNMLGLALAMRHNELKRNALSAARDTHYNITFAEAVAIVEAQGFQLLATVAFKGNPWDDTEEPSDEEKRIYWNPELSALLTMETYRTTSLNMGKVYFAWKANDQNNVYPSGCSGGCEGERGDYTFVGDYDIREAFVYKLTRMKETGTFIKKWPKAPFLWMLHWMDTKDEGYDYKAINAERFALLPAEVREAMGV